MIHVIAIITAKPGKCEELLAAFNKVVPLVHAEVGCIEYQPVVDADNAGPMQTELGPDAYMVVEKWNTMDDLKAHAASEHMANYASNVGDLIASRTIYVMNQAAE